MTVIFPHLSVNFNVLAHQRSDVANVAQMIGKDDRGERTFGVFGAKVDVLEAAWALGDLFDLTADTESIPDFLGRFEDRYAGRRGKTAKQKDNSDGQRRFHNGRPCGGCD